MSAYSGETDAVYHAWLGPLITLNSHWLKKWTVMISELEFYSGSGEKARAWFIVGNKIVKFIVADT